MKKGGDEAIKRWIAGQLQGRSCAVVLVGAGTAGRKWITHEIIEAWNANKGVVGVRVHGLKDNDQNTASSGGNPFDHVTFTKTGTTLSAVVKLHDPTDWWEGSSGTYRNIKKNLAGWIEEALEIRSQHD